LPAFLKNFLSFLAGKRGGTDQEELWLRQRGGGRGLSDAGKKIVHHLKFEGEERHIGFSGGEKRVNLLQHLAYAHAQKASHHRRRERKEIIGRTENILKRKWERKTRGHQVALEKKKGKGKHKDSYHLTEKG